MKRTTQAEPPWTNLLIALDSAAIGARALFQEDDFWGLIWISSASTIYEGLPKLDTISFWVGEPAKPSKIVTFAFGIDRDAFIYQTVEHSIEVIHMKVDHYFLCRRKVLIVLPEESEDHLSALRQGWKRERPFGPH
jgi:hypothetical protein